MTRCATGAAPVARLRKGVGTHPYSTRRDNALLGASGNLISGRLVNQVTRVRAEPPVRPYALRRAA